MLKYSSFFNTQIGEANTAAVEDGADSFTGGEGGTANVTQTSYIGVTQSGTKTITHTADATGTRIVQVVKYIDGSSGLTNTTLDFDLVDEDDFIQEDSVSGTDFVDGTVTLHATGSGLTPTTFDPINHHDPLLVLSNNNLTALNPAGSIWRHVLSEAVDSTGKFYFEVTKDNPNLCFVGITTHASIEVAGPGALNSTELVSLFLINPTQLYTNGTDTSEWATAVGIASTSAVTGVAVDCDTRQVWFIYNNVWLDGGNPEMGTAEAAIVAGTNPLAAFTAYHNAAGMTINFGDTAFTYTVPAGFTAGFGSGYLEYTPSTPETENPAASLVIHADGDDSSNNHEITHNGTVTYFPKAPAGGTAINYGTNGYLIVGDEIHPFDFSSTYAFTFEFWIFVDISIGDEHHSVFWGMHSFRAEVDDDFFEMSYLGTVLTTPIVYNQWIHFAVVKNGTTTKLYKNGVLADSNNNTITVDAPSGPFAIGAAYDGTWLGFPVKLGDFRISTIERYTTDFTPHITPLVSDDDTALLINSDTTDGSTTFTDLSSNNHTITPEGNIRHEVIVPIGDGAVTLPDSASYLEIPHDGMFNFGANDFTIEWFAKMGGESSTTNNMCFSKMTPGALGWQFYWGMSSTLYCYNSAYADIYASIPLPLDGWFHFALVSVGGVFIAYVDGVPYSMGTTTLTDTTATLKIGSISPSAGNWYGSVCELRISDTARYTTTFSGSLQTEPFTDDANTLFLLHGDGVTKDIYNITTYGDPQLKAGKFDEAFYFDGTDDIVTVSDSPDLWFDDGDFTIDMWVNPASIEVINKVIFGKGVGNGFVPIAIHVGNPPGILEIFVSYNGSSWAVAGAVGGYIVNGVWSHVALVRSGTDLLVFNDGVLKSTTDLGTNSLWRNEGVGLALGARAVDATAFWTGYIDEFRITKGTAIWTENFTPPTTPYTIAGVIPAVDNSKYVTTSDDNHLSLATISTINSVSITDTIPASTTLGCLASFDGRTTWKKYDGSWTTVSGLDFTGATVSGIETGLTSYSVTDETYLDFAFQLDTTDNGASPEVDLITMNYDEEGIYGATRIGIEYDVEFISSTSTDVTKLSAGTENIKVNILF